MDEPTGDNTDAMDRNGDRWVPYEGEQDGVLVDGWVRLGADPIWKATWNDVETDFGPMTEFSTPSGG